MMKNDRIPNFAILDCTIRDGGYINNWRFDSKLVREVYRALSKSGVDYIEIGYRGTGRHFNKDEYGLWRFTPEETVREVTSDIKGARIAVMADYGKIDANDFCDSRDSVIELVRVAAHKDGLKGAVALCEAIKNKGYSVALNAMGYTNYDDRDRSYLIKLLKSTELDYIYVVDSYGALLPYQVRPILEPLLEIGRIKVGFHPHNSLQMAFANTLEAVQCGVHIVDATIYGMGRAAGNMPTEIIISFLEKEKGDRYNSMPLLNIIDRYFAGMQKDGGWGYQLPYMLSAMFQCHPNYAKALVDSHEYTIEDIWKAMEYVKAKAPVGFSKSILEEIINGGFIGGAGDITSKKASPGDSSSLSVAHKRRRKVSYEGRHEGRDFLILANGPSLKNYKDKINRLIAKYDPVILGANYLGNLFVPHYHAFSNKRRFISYVDTVALSSELLIGEHIPDSLVREYTNRDYEELDYVDSWSDDFDIKDGVIMTNCRTVAVLLLGVAIVMGARRVFAVGMDGYVEKGSEGFHFYDEKDEKEDREMILERHRWCHKFISEIDAYLASRGKEGVHILTPTSYRSFYKGIENYI